jgi:GDSL-like Lipase/Acylhydrolase family
MKRVAFGLLGLVVLALAAVALYLGYLGRAGEDPAFFESEIEAFLEADREHPPEPGRIVFVGSSSIRFWSSLETDMAPLPVLRRGFGGAQLSHVIHNAPRIVIPYAPRAVVVYAGDNDISAGKSADTIVADFESLVGLLQSALPEADIYFLSIKPSRLRWSHWPEASRANARIQSLAEADPRLHFIDVGQVLLGPDGKPRRELFRFDGLHLSAEGYAAWTSVVAPVLHAAYATPAVR